MSMFPKHCPSKIAFVLGSYVLIFGIAASVLVFLVAREKEEIPELLQHGKQWAQLHPMATFLAEASTDDLPELVKKKRIRVLTTLNKTNFFVDDGDFAGFEYALLNDYQNFLNRNNKGIRIVLEYIITDRNDLLPRLKQGYGDIAAAGLTVTRERQKEVAFTIPYLTHVREVIVTHKGGFSPTSLEDLAGHKVYLRGSSSYWESLVWLNESLEARGLEPVKLEKLDENIETESILRLVNEGKISITVADEHIAQAWSMTLPYMVIHEDLALRTGGNIAWMVRKDNPKLLASLNAFLKTRKPGSLQGNMYFDRYYTPSPAMKTKRELGNWDKLRKYKGSIKKYAEKYGFDWRLILAMAFQESRLDNDKVSALGAEGLLQVRPATAAGKHVRITELGDPAKNIHAGVKYLHFLRKHYFNSSAISPGDQIRFALAAYNAGPGNIRMARKKAKKMGLNPNRWFRNVEVAVFKTIGRQPVQYVSNINTYYILYATILDEEQKAREAMQKESRMLEKNVQ